MSSFRKAARSQAKLRLALCGVSGSGKTYSALTLASGMGGKVALIDTERGSGELYSADFDYDVAQLVPPFTPQRYISLMAEAAQEYDILIIDSLTHAWTGQGGVLEMHDNAAAGSRSGNSYTAWRDVTPHHNALVDAIMASPAHIIATMRSKTAYEVQDTGNGKKTPVKIGLAPVQRDGMEYEFTAVLDISLDNHIASASKDRTRLFDGLHESITRNTGVLLMDWLQSGVNGAGILAGLMAGLGGITEVAALREYLKSGGAAIHGRVSPAEIQKFRDACTVRAAEIQAQAQQ